MRILLVSTYELGHQPIHLAAPRVVLEEAGHQVSTLDVSVDAWDDDPEFDAVAFSVPMHTALRLALPLATRIHEEQPQVPVAFYGLYAGQAPEWAARLVGEYQPALVAWASNPVAATVIDLKQHRFAAPWRDGLPTLDRYAMLIEGESMKLVGYVEGSHGCRHRCRHCPIPAVYDGRFRVVGKGTVLEDIAAQVAAGAEHITFGDPDFLNAPRDSLDLLEAAHERFPLLTFDLTVKVSHILDHRSIWDRVADLNVLFVVSAFETTNDRALGLLDKGHTSADMAEAVGIMRRAEIELRPSWLPFSPWTEPGDLADIFEFLAEHDLLATVDPVQLSIRLLVPQGSLLADEPVMGAFDSATLTHAWTSPYPEVERQQQLMAQMAESGSIDDPLVTVEKMWQAVMDRPFPPVTTTGHPRLSEPWFCCAEPTQTQLLAIGRPG